jgi:hypothetical protein
VDHAQSPVAVAHGIDDDPQAREVEDLIELLVSPHHLVVDGVEVLDAPVHVGLYPGLAQVPDELRPRSVDEGLPVAAACGHEALYLLVAPRVQGGKREVLELPLERVDPEPVGQRSVDLQRLRGLGKLGLALEVGERAHVVEPVGELDDDDAHVPAHRHDHLPQGLRLGVLQVPGGQPLELGDPVDDLRQIVPELLFELLLGDAGVLQHVVQQGGRDRRRVEAQLGEDVCRRERVVDEGLPALAGLAPVRRVGHRVCLGQQLLGPFGAVGGDLLYERRYGYVRGRYGPRPFLCSYRFHTTDCNTGTREPFRAEASTAGATGRW